MSFSLLNQDDLIYKYVPFSFNTLKMLIQGTLWFGYPESLNDPFEGEFILNNCSELPDQQFLENFYKENMNLSKFEIKDKLVNIKKNKILFEEDIKGFLKRLLKKEYGVSCFSKTPGELLMWSHYADSHKGICLVFNKTELLKSLKNTWHFIKADEITYDTPIPEIKIKLQMNEIDINPDKMFLLNKFENWNYEQEIRFHHHFQNNIGIRNVPFDKKCLKGILLGENFCNDNLNTIVNLIRVDPDYNITWGKACKDLKERKMDIKEVKYAFIEKKKKAKIDNHTRKN